MLGLSIAGTSVSGAGAKTILAAITSGVAGSKQVVDKNYYFEKTIPALIGQMNAERKKALIPLLVGMQANVNDYRFEQAVTDIQSYYDAGSFNGAIEAIQVDASVKEQHQDAIIATLTTLPQDKIDLKKRLTETIGSLYESDLEKVKNAIKEIDPTSSPAEDFVAAKGQLQSYIRKARTPAQIAEVSNAFNHAGIPID